MWRKLLLTMSQKISSFPLCQQRFLVSNRNHSGAIDRCRFGRGSCTLVLVALSSGSRFLHNIFSVSCKLPPLKIPMLADKTRTGLEGGSDLFNLADFLQL